MSYVDISSLFALCLYSLSLVTVLLGLLGKKTKLSGIAIYFAVAAFILHSSSLTIEGIFTLVSRSTYLLLLSWFISLIGLISYKIHKQVLFFALTIPVTFILYLSFFLLQSVSHPLPANFISPLFYIHICTVFLGISCLTLSFAVAILFLIQEKAVKSKLSFLGFRKELPALATLDRLNSKTVAFGFPLYTLGIMFGFLWARLSWGEIFSGDPKELVSIGIFILYAILFHGRLALSWKGKKPAYFSIFIFVLYALSVVVVNTFMSTHHSFFMVN